VGSAHTRQDLPALNPVNGMRNSRRYTVLVSMRLGADLRMMQGSGWMVDGRLSDWCERSLDFIHGIAYTSFSRADDISRTVSVD